MTTEATPDQQREVLCRKCGGEGWLWWHELDRYDGPAVETGTDDTRYQCDACAAIESIDR